MCVQALLSHQLSPALVQGTTVQRLNEWVTTQQKGPRAEKPEGSSPDPSEPDEDPSLSSIGVPTAPSHDSMELDVTVASTEGDNDGDDDDDEDEDEDEEAPDQVRRARGVIRPTPKRPWTEEDIRFLIELRAMGMTHKQTAVRL